MYNKAQIILCSIYREYCVVTLKSGCTTYVKDSLKYLDDIKYDFSRLNKSK